MKCLSFLITFLALIFFSSPSFSQLSSSEKKAYKRVKKTAKQYPILIKYICADPGFDQGLIDQITEGLGVVRFAELRSPTVQYLTQGCMACEEAKSLLIGSKNSGVYVYKHQNNNNVACKPQEAGVYASIADIDSEIVSKILASPKQKHTFYIYIPEKAALDYENKLAEGWQVVKPKNASSLDTCSVLDCLNRKVILYKERNCIEPEGFELLLELDNSLWSNDEYGSECKNFFVPEWDEDSYYFFSKKICSDDELLYELVFFDDSQEVTSVRLSTLDSISPDAAMKPSFPSTLKENSKFLILTFRKGEVHDVLVDDQLRNSKEWYYFKQYEIFLDISDTRNQKIARVPLGDFKFYKCAK